MSLFGSIMEKVFHHGDHAMPTGTAPAAPPVPSAPASTPEPTVAASTPSPVVAAAPTQPVDVEQVLEGMAAQKGGGGNWRMSIVDLLKLLDLDSSLQARKALAEELNVHVGADGSAEENVALSKAVWAKLAENGGKVPGSLH